MVLNPLSIAAVVLLPVLIALGLSGILRLRAAEITVWTIGLGSVLLAVLWYGLASPVLLSPTLESVHRLQYAETPSSQAYYIRTLATYLFAWVPATIVFGLLAGLVFARTRSRWEAWMFKVLGPDVIAESAFVDTIMRAKDSMVMVVVDGVVYSGRCDDLQYGKEADGINISLPYVNAEPQSDILSIYLPKERISYIGILEELGDDTPEFAAPAGDP